MMGIDIEIAEKVMNLIVLPEEYGIRVEPEYQYDNGVHFRYLLEWSPSTDITDAWLVVEKMRELDWGFKLIITRWLGKESCDVYFFKKVFSCGVMIEKPRYRASEETAPMAVCKAALLSLGDK